LWYSSNETMEDFPRRGPGARSFVVQRVCYAESSDGIRFDKAPLGASCASDHDRFGPLDSLGRSSFQMGDLPSRTPGAEYLLCPAGNRPGRLATPSPLPQDAGEELQRAAG